MKELMGKTFVAKLFCMFNQYKQVVSLSEAPTIVQRGWLKPSYSHDKAVELKFQYLRYIDDRYLYAITGAEGEFVNSGLGVSHNGYVGLYNHAAVDNVWKFDFTEADDDGQGFWLRDKDGQRIAEYEAPVAGVFYLPGVGGRYLNVAAGEVGRFEVFAARLV